MKELLEKMSKVEIAFGVLAEELDGLVMMLARHPERDSPTGRAVRARLYEIADVPDALSRRIEAVKDRLFRG